MPGFGAHLDCNKVYKDYEQIMIQAGLQGHKTAEPDADTKPNALPLQKLAHWPRIQRRCTDAVQAGAGAWAGGSRAVQGRADRRADHADLTIGPVSSGDAWLIMRAALELTDRGLYLAEYVTE